MEIEYVWCLIIDQPLFEEVQFIVTANEVFSCLQILQVLHVHYLSFWHIIRACNDIFLHQRLYIIKMCT